MKRMLFRLISPILAAAIAVGAIGAGAAEMAGKRRPCR